MSADEYWNQISIHALLAESDIYFKATQEKTLLFLSTLSLRRATGRPSNGRSPQRNFYPRSPCGERQLSNVRIYSPSIISIHALLAESDAAVISVAVLFPDISIHALLAESDYFQPKSRFRILLFLSTLSLRRATCEPVKCFCCCLISIHALLAESDDKTYRRLKHETIKFLSTLSLRRATQIASSMFFILLIFLSTLSLRRATFQISYGLLLLVISIHALLAESDCATFTQDGADITISIHALLAESDALTVPVYMEIPISIHALLAESDHALFPHFRCR